VQLEVADLIELGANRLPGYLGIEVDGIEDGHSSMHLDLRDEHMAPNGYLHAGTVVTLADSACGYGCIMSLPDGATGFTTIELKSNFLATALKGTLYAKASRVHAGRTTQVWDATVTNEEGKTIALFRCTQLLLYPS
jgi:1,4-dihydroxy-2-naphthoyl-CoA hydrolase